MVELPIYVRRPSLDFLVKFDRKCTNDAVDEINFIFISDLKNNYNIALYGSTNINAL